MGDELSDTVSATIGGDQVYRGMPLEEVGKAPSCLTLGNGFASPDTCREMRLAEASWVDLMLLETELHFERFEFPQPGIDGNRASCMIGLHGSPPPVSRSMKTSRSLGSGMGLRNLDQFPSRISRPPQTVVRVDRCRDEAAVVVSSDEDVVADADGWNGGNPVNLTSPVRLRGQK